MDEPKNVEKEEQEQYQPLLSYVVESGIENGRDVHRKNFSRNKMIRKHGV